MRVDLYKRNLNLDLNLESAFILKAGSVVAAQEGALIKHIFPDGRLHGRAGGGRGGPAEHHHPPTAAAQVTHVHVFLM